MIAVPPALARVLDESEAAPAMKAGKYLAFSHGFGIHFGFIKPPKDVNVFMVAPKGPGHLVRHQFSQGAGVPCLLAVHPHPRGATKKLRTHSATPLVGGPPRR